jgi:hypothetical protein
MKDLERLASLVAELNATSAKIATLIGRPALVGHVGEYLAAKLFDIDLQPGANAAGIDGHFRAGQLQGRAVNVKMYPVRENVIDINPSAVADYYLVLAGPKGGAVSSRGRVRPWLIDGIYLFDGPALVADLRTAGRHVGVGTSVSQPRWDAAEIYPRSNCDLLTLAPEFRAWIPSFGR